MEITWLGKLMSPEKRFIGGFNHSPGKAAVKQPCLHLQRANKQICVLPLRIHERHSRSTRHAREASNMKNRLKQITKRLWEAEIIEYLKKKSTKQNYHLIFSENKEEGPWTTQVWTTWMQYNRRVLICGWLTVRMQNLKHGGPPAIDRFLTNPKL